MNYTPYKLKRDANTCAISIFHNSRTILRHNFILRYIHTRNKINQKRNKLFQLFLISRISPLLFRLKFKKNRFESRVLTYSQYYLETIGEKKKKKKNRIELELLEKLPPKVLHDIQRKIVETYFSPFHRYPVIIM